MAVAVVGRSSGGSRSELKVTSHGVHRDTKRGTTGVVAAILLVTRNEAAAVAA